MATTRPATLPLSGRRPDVRDVAGDAVVTDVAEVELVGTVVGADAVVLAAPELDRLEDSAVVGVDADLLVAGRVVVGAVVAGMPVTVRSGAGLAAVDRAMDVEAGVGVSGSLVRAVVESSGDDSAGTVTSGTVPACPALLDRTAGDPGMACPVLSRTVAEVRTDWSTPAPQAASSRVAMP